jgi:hypothetical protein
MSEVSLLYLKRAGALVNDASAYGEQCNRAAPATDDDLRKSMVREALGIKIALLAINRQLTVFAATVNRKSSQQRVQHHVNREP